MMLTETETLDANGIKIHLICWRWYVQNNIIYLRAFRSLQEAVAFGFYLIHSRN